MKAVVTGGVGFIGSHLVDALVARGDKVVIIDDLSRGNAERAPRAARLFTLDVTSKAARLCIARERPDVIFHLAAQIDVRRSVADPAYDARVNIIGTLNIAQAAADSGVKCLVFSSTGGAIYGEQKVLPADEAHPCMPESPYGLAKAAAERYLDYVARTTSLRAVSLRYSNVYGPRQDPHGEAGVVAIFAGKLLADKTPVIFGDGQQTRDFVYVRDVVHANLLACDTQAAHGVFNIGSGEETSVLRLYDMVAEAADKDIAPTFAPARRGEQRRSAIDVRLAAARLRWTPQQTLQRGLHVTVRSFAAQEAQPI